MLSTASVASHEVNIEFRMELSHMHRHLTLKYSFLRFRSFLTVGIFVAAIYFVAFSSISLFTFETHAQIENDNGPTNVVVTPGYQSITVTWDPPPPHPDGYRLTGYSHGLRIGTEHRDRFEDHAASDGRTFTYTEYKHKTTGFQCDGQDVDLNVLSPLCNGTEYQIKIWAHFDDANGVGGDVDDTGWISVTVGGDEPVVTPSPIPSLTAPGAPRNVVVTPGINQLQVDWEPPVLGTNNAPTNYVVQWKAGGQNYSTSRQAGTNAATTHTITNLTGGQPHQIRVRAENSAGGTWSSDVPGTPITGPTVTRVENTAVTDSTAVIVVTLTNPESTNQTVNLQYRTPRGSGTWEVVSPLSTSTTSREFTLGSLMPNSNYEVQASLDSNFQTEVRSTSFTTHGPPTNLRLRVTPANEQLKLSWSVSLNGGSVGSQSVEWKVTTSTNFTGSATPGNDARSHTIENLTNDTEYTVRVTVTTNYGSVTSDDVSRSPASGPSVDDITFTNINRTSATANVSVINTQLVTGTLTAHLRHRVKGTPEWSTAAPRNVSGTTASFSMTGLTGNTIYEVEASLIGDFADSILRELTTAKSAPHAPEAVVLTHADSELSISWVEPSNDGGEAITGYTVQWKSGNESYSNTRQLQTDANTTAVDITGLINGREYKVRVFATNSIGDGPAVEVTGTPSTEPPSAATGLLASACDRSLHLSWRPPTNDGGSPIISYRVQWKTDLDTDYDENARQMMHNSATPFFTLSGLTNGTAYTVRILPANMNGDAADVDSQELWSNELTATPRPGACLLEVRFGNALANSVPVYVTVMDAPAGTSVYLRYRTTAPSAWSGTHSEITRDGETTVTINLTGLQPETDYEVEVSLDPGFSPTGSTVRAFFTSGMGSTSGIRGAGSFARILRIEPTAAGITVHPEDRVVLSVDVYGRQDILDNSLADRSPTDGRPSFTWTGGGRGSFKEIDMQSDWRNAVADDRQVIFTASSVPGTYTITTILAEPGECQLAIGDETAEDARNRCSADFTVTVRRQNDFNKFEVPPVNPVGMIPNSITGADEHLYAAFTPEGGGEVIGDGISLVAGPGAVVNGEYIGMRISPTGVASNAGKTWQRYTLVGTKYGIGVINESGKAVSRYALEEAATVCVPLPAELRESIAGVVLVVIDDDQELTALSSSVSIGSEGVQVCGALSSLPAMIAVGSVGSPPEAAEDEHELLPDTGGVAPAHSTLLVLAMSGIAMIAVAFVVSSMGRRRRTYGRLP